MVLDLTIYDHSHSSIKNYFSVILEALDLPKLELGDFDNRFSQVIKNHNLKKDKCRSFFRFRLH